MNYIKGLYDTYNKLEEQGLIGQYDEDGLGVFPKYHNIKGIDKKGSAYEVVINSLDGSYTINKIVTNSDKNKKYLVYPTTIASTTRTSDLRVPHGVCEELQYLSMSYAGISNNFTTYLNNLKEWLEFTEGDYWLEAVYNFMEYTSRSKENDIVNLIRSLYPDELIDKKTFVIFTVDSECISNSKRLQDMWVYYIDVKYKNGYEGFKNGFDELTGNKGIIPRKFPTVIATAKILSKSKDTLEPHIGRFIRKSESSDVFSITYNTAQKSYNLLSYLLKAKGNNSKWLGANTTLIMWTDGEEISPGQTLEEELDEFVFDDEDTIEVTDSTIQEYLSNTFGLQTNGLHLNSGYNVYILMLVKTNQGRVAIKKYQKLTDLGYQEVLDYWYATTSWESVYTNENTKQVSLGLRALVNNLFGREEEMNKFFNLKVNQGFEGKAVSLIEELMEAKMNKQRLPIKFYKKAMMNARQRHRYKNTWDKTLLTTLSMYKKYQWDYKNKYVGVDVEVGNQTNSYLYGRLMAVYEQIESTALYYRGTDKRQTFVEKNWASIINRPLHMWDRMATKTSPYMNYLLRNKPGIHHKFSILVLELGSQLAENGDFATKGKKPLDDDFILGYYHQLKALRQKNTNNNQEEDTNE